MHFLSIAVLASLTTAISATPTPPANESLEFRTPVDSVNTGTETKLTKRDVVHFYVCTDEDFGGTCENLSTNTGVCYNLYTPYQDSISSARPDAGVTCTVWKDGGCTGSSKSGIVSPGIFNFKNYSFNDAITSYSCFRS